MIHLMCAGETVPVVERAEELHDTDELRKNILKRVESGFIVKLNLECEI